MKKIDFKKELNSEQYEAVTAGKGPHLVLAGAGSGKTRTLTYRAAWLISQGVDPSKILLLTFTNKAAKQMMDRVRNILGLKSNQKLPLWGGTFHSMANRLLRFYGKHINLRSDFTILDEDDKKALLKMIIKDILKNLSDKNRPSPAIVAETISFAANSGITIEESLETKFGEWLPMQEFFEKIAAEYKRRKELSNVLDFDDLLLKWLELVRHPEAGKILANKWEYVLVDEYQDTNVIQAEVIFYLAQKNKNLLVVGDDAQSIYSFRAADIRNILDFPTKFSDCKIYKLETNYRSTPEILDLANSIISANNSQFHKNLKAILESHVRPELVALMSQTEEARFVAERIDQLLERGIEPNQIAVLFRAAHHSQALEMELNKRGVDYEMRGGLKFFARAHVKDVLAWLKILGNMRDEVAWLRILQIQPSIGPVTAQLIYQKIVESENLENLLEVKFNLADKAAQSWNQVMNLLDKLVKHKKDKISDLINIIADDYQTYLREKYPDYRQRQDDLDQLAVFAGTYSSLELFLNEMSLQENFSAKGSAEENKDAVILSTVHQAKGLEWEAVFVINMTDQSFPHPLSSSQEEQEEERRLFYVAATRAIKYLYLTYPLAMMRYDGYKSFKPSPFVTQLDSNLFQHNELSRSATYQDDDVQYVSEDGFLPDVSDW